MKKVGWEQSANVLERKRTTINHVEMKMGTSYLVIKYNKVRIISISILGV